MSISELKDYLSNRINAIKKEIGKNEKKLAALNKQIKDNEITIKTVENSKDTNYVQHIGRQFDLNLNPDPLFLPLLKTILTDKIRTNNISIEEEIRETKKSIMYYRQDLKTIDTCPLCGGMGQKIEVEYIRQGGTVQPVRHIIECSACKGTGKILNLSK